MIKNSIRRKVISVFSVALLLSSINLKAADEESSDSQPAIELGAPFADNAVVQRGMRVPVWGWSKPGTKVTVAFKGQKRKGKAGKDGKWVVRLKKLKASFEPAEMTITEAGGKTVTLKNILVGEIWMASGQSNMQWKAGSSTARDLKVEPVGEQEIAPIREFEVTSVYSVLHPIKKATGSWKDGEYGSYSAISFAFAHKLYEELGVPIGILNTAFSTTKIQAWIPRVGFRDGDSEYTRAIYQDILKTDPRTPEHEKAWGKFYQNIEDALEANKAISTDRPGNMDGNRDDSWMFNGRVSPVVPYAIRGAIWNQGWASQGEGLKYYNNLHSLVRGWRLVWDEPKLPVYFHQFYSNSVSNKPTFGGAADMRLGTWLARDIPNADMACQIDIGGAIHYRKKTVPGQRLARQALKNQYGKDVVANGPMFEGYEVKGNRLIVEFEHTDGGLVVADPSYNATERHEDSTGFADPKIIENGEEQVELFYVADENRVWHPAEVEIEGEKVIVTAPGVDKPHGVSYATGGAGFQPNLYNKALLPMSPFIVYDHELVTAENWPHEKLKIAGEKIDPSKVGKLYDYRKMPLLSTQFRDNAVLQAGQPVTIWGGAVHPYVRWGVEEKRTEGEAVVHFSLNGIEKDIPVTDDMTEWQVTVPPMKASAEPKTLKVTFTIDGELVHERVQENIVVGDVWYVAAPAMELDVPEVEASGQVVRMMQRQAKRDSTDGPSRYSVCVSTTPENRFASYWKEAEGLAGALGHTIAAKTGKPVGIIFMKPNEAKELKHWIHPEYLDEAPSLMADYKDLAAARPGNKYYRANARRYMSAWKNYWNDYIPEMIETKAVPDGASWGWYPRFQGRQGRLRRRRPLLRSPAAGAETHRKGARGPLIEGDRQAAPE
ncbi:MAG: sialate O-acetylesterase, partial [Lentisphaeria bacterium]